MWQTRGFAPKGGDDVMAVMNRFLAMAPDVSRAGKPQPYIDDSQSLSDR
jgi:hypothetical protein